MVKIRVDGAFSLSRTLPFFGKDLVRRLITESFARAVGDLQVHFQVGRKMAELLFEPQLSVAVAAAAVAEQRHPRCMDKAACPAAATRAGSRRTQRPLVIARSG